MFKTVIIYFENLDTQWKDIITFLNAKHRDELEFKLNKLWNYISYHFVINKEWIKTQTRWRNEIWFHNKNYSLWKRSLWIFVQVEWDEATSKQYLKALEIVNWLSKIWGAIKIEIENWKWIFVNKNLIKKLLKPKNDLIKEWLKCKKKFFDNLDWVNYLNEWEIKSLITIALNKS